MRVATRLHPDAAPCALRIEAVAAGSADVFRPPRAMSRINRDQPPASHKKNFEEEDLHG
jgi:hypothetical protein